MSVAEGMIGEGFLTLACAHLQLVHVIHTNLVVRPSLGNLAAVRAGVCNALQ